MIVSFVVSSVFHGGLALMLLFLMTENMSLIETTNKPKSIVARIASPRAVSAPKPTVQPQAKPQKKMPTKVSDTPKPDFEIVDTMNEYLLDDALASAQQEISELQKGSGQLKKQAEHYHQALETRVARLWNVPLSAQPDEDCEYLVHLSPSGHIIDLELMRSSGNEALDRSVKQAIIKAAPLPIPQDPTWYQEFKYQRLIFGPKQLERRQKN